MDFEQFLAHWCYDNQLDISCSMLQYTKQTQQQSGSLKETDLEKKVTPICSLKTQEEEGEGTEREEEEGIERKGGEESDLPLIWQHFIYIKLDLREM